MLDDGDPHGNPNRMGLRHPGHLKNSYVDQKSLRIRSISFPAHPQQNHERLAPDLLYLFKSVPPLGWDMELQPKIEPVTLNQLRAEIRAVYIGAVKVETLCCEKIASCKHAAAPLTDEQWRSLVDLHKATMYEFADFFFATQHPAATRSRPIRESRLKYNMPQRLWQRIHALLDLMRRNLPAAEEHMAGFISLSFTLLTVLYEHAVGLEGIWSECLGDVARFGMAVQTSLEERSIWLGSSRMWYLKAIDLSPNVGRLSHHLAILSRPEPMGQLFHFIKSLCAVTPFGPARESIATLFNPVFSREMGLCEGLDVVAVKLHGLVMLNGSDEEYSAGLTGYTTALSDSLGADPTSWELFGYHLAVVNVNSLLSYCSETNPLSKALGVSHNEVKAFGFEASEKSAATAFERAVEINLVTIRTMLQIDDVSPFLSYFHVWLAFLHSVSKLPPKEVPPRFLKAWPWEQLSLGLGGVSVSCCILPTEEVEFLSPQKEPPLPEDYAMRGLVWASKYLPSGWFDEDTRDQDERVIEGQWVKRERARRCAWLEKSLAEVASERGEDACEESYTHVGVLTLSV